MGSIEGDDARVYSNSFVNKPLRSGNIPQAYQELIPGETPVPQFLIGDPAYPLLPNIMKEYSTVSDAKHLLFNNVIRSTRNQIECAFGRLKARWRILNRLIDVELEFGVSMIYCCFVLHNFCEKHKVELNFDTVAAQISLDQRCQNCQHHNAVMQ